MNFHGKHRLDETTATNNRTNEIIEVYIVRVYYYN